MRTVLSLAVILALAVIAGLGGFALRRWVAGGDRRLLGTGSGSAVSDRTWSDPEPLRGFAVWEEPRRLAVATALQGDPGLSAEVLACVRRLIRDRRLSPAVRNNLANALVDQRRSDPELYRLFLAMLDDPAEGPVWRDYCVQFLGCCLPFAVDRARVVAKLTAVASNGGPIAGTALLHLAYNEAIHMVRLPDDFYNRITESLWRKTTLEPTKLAILGLLGRTGDPDHLPAVRRVLAAPSSATALRGALGALGRLGIAADALLVEPFRTHSDQAVVLAAEAAAESLAAQDGGK